MKMNVQSDGVINTIALCGELDHHTAKAIIGDISVLIDTRMPHRLIFDFKDLTFMDSSGIAVILGAYRRISEVGGSLNIVNVPKQALRVLNAAGVGRIVKIEKEQGE